MHKFCTKQFNVCSHASSSVPFNVSHQRLGHMSHNKMQVVPDIGLTLGEMKDFVCEICPKAKQHRLSFPNNKTLSDYVFQLLHVDTWRPYHTKTHTGHKYF